MERLRCSFDQRDLKSMTKRMLTELMKLIAQKMIVRKLRRFGMVGQKVIVQTLRCFGKVVAQKVTARKGYFAVVQRMR